MSPWDGASRWVNTLLLVVVGFVGFDTLFRLLEANERNVIVGFTRSVATILLAPFEGMFDEQEYLLTALIAVLGYALLAGIAMAVIRSIQASARRRVRRQGGSPDIDPHGNATGWSQSPPAAPRLDEGDTRDTTPPLAGSPPRGGPWSGEARADDPPDGIGRRVDGHGAEATEPRQRPSTPPQWGQEDSRRQ